MGTTNVRNPSLWVGTSDEVAPGRLDGDITADAVVVGAGITGLTAARLLAGEGLSVVVIEAGEVCAGATGFTTAKVTSLHGTIYTRLTRVWGKDVAAVYAEANEAAIATIRRLVADHGIDCQLEDASAYTYTESPARLADIEKEVEAASSAGLDASFTSSTDLPYEVLGAVRVDRQAHFHPRQYCLGLVAAVLGMGASVFDGTRAVSIDRRAGQVTTDRGVVTADVIVLACHVPFVKAGGHFARMAPTRSYATAFRAGGERPRGMYISAEQPTRSVRSTPDGWVIVGGEGHRVGHDDDTTRRYRALEAWAEHHFAAASIGFRWSAQDYESADGLPFIGRLTPGSANVLIATGFGKWGMTNGTVAAMIITDLASGRANPWAETFDASRLAVRQSALRVLHDNVVVGRRFIGDRLAPASVPDVDQLAPGSGAIASLGGERVAAFRDDAGGLHAVSPTCTHLGCRVTFNSAEQTWDCPCHGSRYDVDGRVVQGPAVRDLATKDG